MTDATSGLGFYIKPRYRHEVLVYNWFEDRAQKDPSFLPLTSREVKKSEKQEKQENCAERHVTDKEHEQAQKLQQQQKEIDNYQKTRAEILKGGVDTHPISPSDILRGYYSTTYRRSYGPRHGYIHMDSKPPQSSAQDSASARGADDQSRPRSSGTIEVGPYCPGAGETQGTNTTGTERGRLDGLVTRETERSREGVEDCRRCQQLSERKSDTCPRCLQLAGL